MTMQGAGGGNDDWALLRAFLVVDPGTVSQAYRAAIATVSVALPARDVCVSAAVFARFHSHLLDLRVALLPVSGPRAEPDGGAFGLDWPHALAIATADDVPVALRVPVLRHVTAMLRRCGSARASTESFPPAHADVYPCFASRSVWALIMSAMSCLRYTGHGTTAAQGGVADTEWRVVDELDAVQNNTTPDEQSAPDTSLDPTGVGVSTSRSPDPCTLADITRVELEMMWLEHAGGVDVTPAARDSADAANNVTPQGGATVHRQLQALLPLPITRAFPLREVRTVVPRCRCTA